jgi:hypothetical protein
MRSCTERREDGFTTVQYVFATACSLLLFVLLANLLVGLYQRGAVRDALDEGVRAAVPAGADVARCERRAREVVAQIGGSVGVDELQCTATPDGVAAHAEITIAAWVLLPDWHLRLEARATRER